MNDVAKLQKENKELRAQIEFFKEQIRLLIARQFGRSSEQISPDQLGLFNEAEQDLDTLEGAEEPEVSEVKAHQRKAKPRISIPDDYPREEIIYDLPEAEKVCPHDGHALVLISHDDHEQVDIIPAQLKVLLHRRLKYACPCCEQHIVTAKKPNQPIEKSIASPGLLAFIATQKYCDALPLHRQSAIFERIGIELNSTNLANWMVKMGDLTQPLIDHFHYHLQQQVLVHMDETILQVLEEPGKAAQSKSYMWLLACFEEYPLLLYYYAPTRNHSIPKGLLSEQTQALMVDGYEGYRAACDEYGIRRLGCMAHARRKFMDAKKALPKGKTGKADQALAFIQKLYRIEARIKEDPPEERYNIRQTEAKPTLEKMRAWLEKSLDQTLPSSKLGEALTYLKNQWERLAGYVEDGRYPIDNNAAERAIRPFTIGRKNWTFARSQAGARASANLYSLVESAKANGLNPYDYLKAIFTRLPNMTTKDDMGELLPWNIKLN